MTLPMGLGGAPPAEIVMRDYQVQAENAIIDFKRRRDERFPHGGQRALVVMATGGGKTTLFADLLRFCRGQLIVVVHRDELVTQAADRIRLQNPGVLVGIEQGEQRASRTDKVIVTMVQTLAQRLPDFLQRFPPSSASMIVVDECHHMIAPTYLLFLSAYGLAPNLEGVNEADLAALSADASTREAAETERTARRQALRERFEAFKPAETAPFLLGVTATSNRTDGRGLEYVLDEIVFSKPMPEMIEEGWLVEPHGFKVKTQTDLGTVKVSHGDFVEAQLTKVVNNADRNELMLQTYQERCPERQAIFFLGSVEHALEMEALFQKAGVNSGHLIGSMDKWERADTNKRLRSGEIRALFNVYVAVEGFDYPPFGAVFIGRPTRSGLIYTQMLGRVLRPVCDLNGLLIPETRKAAIAASVKPDALVFDFVDINKRAAVQTLPTLFGLPPKLDLKGQGVLAAKGGMPDTSDVPDEMLLDAETVSDVAKIVERFDPLAQTLLEPEIAAATPFAWVKTGSGYILNLRGDGAGNSTQIGIVIDTLGRAIVRTKRRGTEPFTLGGPFNSVQEAFALADGHVREVEPGAGYLDRNARWRRDPATAPQLSLMRSLGVLFPVDCSKGQAKQLIDAKLTERENTPASKNQLGYLRSKGVSGVTKEMSAGEAQRLIVLVQKNEKEARERGEHNGY